MSENSLSCYIIVSTLVCWYSDVHAREKSVCPAQRHYYDVKTSFVQRLSSEFNRFFLFFFLILWNCGREHKHQRWAENEIQITKMRSFTELQTLGLFWEISWLSWEQIYSVQHLHLVSSMTQFLSKIYDTESFSAYNIPSSLLEKWIASVEKKTELVPYIMHTLCCDGHY